MIIIVIHRPPREDHYPDLPPPCLHINYILHITLTVILFAVLHITFYTLKFSLPLHVRLVTIGLDDFYYLLICSGD